MTEPTTGHDDALDAALRGMPRPAIDAAQREAHIAAALGELGASEMSNDTNVVSLASRRRPRLALLSAVAAAGLFVVGLGIGRVSAPDAPAPSQVKNSALTTLAVAGDSNSPAVPACPLLDIPGPTRTVTSFGTYVLVRSGAAESGVLTVVQTTTCSIVTRVDLAATEG